MLNVDTNALEAREDTVKSTYDCRNIKEMRSQVALAAIHTYNKY